VGSVVVEKLLDAGHVVSIIDNLQQGHRQAVLPSAKLIVGDFRDVALLDSVFADGQFGAVMHMAAVTLVEYSMSDPQRYFDNNLSGGLVLLNTMLKHEVKKLIFSSTASVYGEPQAETIWEEHPKVPVNSYGESKLMFEGVLRWYARAYALEYISFRYFCAAGATQLLGEDHDPETHLIPNVLLKSLRPGRQLTVYGDDYPTPDGSCIRDFVHVSDIADAHVLALGRLDKLTGNAFNLGNSQGYSVLDVIRTAEKITGRKIPYQIGGRRAGDAIVLIAGSQKARQQLGWQPQYPDLESMLESAWQWFNQHPAGYER